MMLAEREEYKLEKEDVSNGFRSRRLMGGKGIIELSGPRTRYGNCYPILLSIVKDQQAQMEQLSFLLYTQGLTTEQIGEVFEQLYAHRYAKQSISRLAQTAHQEVLDWLERPLDYLGAAENSSCLTSIAKISSNFLFSSLEIPTSSSNGLTLLTNACLISYFQ